MARSTVTMAFLTSLLVLLTTCLHLVTANDPNIGFAVSINTTGTIVYPSDDVAFLVGPPEIEYTFIVPVTITRRTSTSDALLLSLFSTPYDYDEDQPPAEIQVYQQQVYFDGLGQQTYDLDATFNLTTSSSDSVVLSLRAQVDILGNSAGNTEGYLDSISGAAVLNYNATSGTWITLLPAEHAHQENVAIHAEFDAEEAQVVGEVIDTSAETVLVQDPDLPEEVVVGVPPREDETRDNTTTTPCVERPTSTPCGGWSTKTPAAFCTTVPTTPCKHETPTAVTTHCRDFESWKRNNDGKPWSPPDAGCTPHPTAWKRHNDGKPWSSSSSSAASCTPSPVVCPPPPTCETHHQYARQAANRANLRLTLTYGPSLTPSPMRQVNVTAFGVLNQRVVSAKGKTDNSGRVTLRFVVAPGEVVQVYRLSVPMDQEKFRVSTRANGETGAFLFWRLISIPIAWEVPAGATTDEAYRFMNKATNDIINVQDRMLTSWIFAKTKIFDFRAKLPHVWFPGEVGPNYFSDPSGRNADLSTAFINIHPEKAKATSPQAHEYGHWFHYLVRRLQPVKYDLVGESHNFCQQGTANSAVVSLTEGYATAFALSALLRSKFQENNGTGYCFFPFNPAKPNCREIERYDCGSSGASARDLSFDEGRVAAVMRDLIDIGEDNSGDDPDLGEAGFADAVDLPYARVLFDPMRENPTSMEDYWNNFKANPSLSQAQIDAAWDVFEYQYAQFDK